jgi:urocanate reductase
MEGEPRPLVILPMHAISTPPFYAARIVLESHDSCGGLRINGKAQVVDLKGQVIPGLYAGGEASGAHLMHGLGKSCTQGYIAGTNAVKESA